MKFKKTDVFLPGIVIPFLLLSMAPCPYVYTISGTKYSFAGELYGGSIYSSLERDDYLLLPDFTAVNGEYRLKITNKQNDRQFTNLADLLLISHPEKSLVYLDKYGSAQIITEPQSPLSALTLNNNDCMRLINNNDGELFLFNDNNSKTSVNHVVLTFENKRNLKSGKLVIRAKNSQWSDDAYAKFNKLFGSYFNKWEEQQKSIPRAEQIKQSLEQDIPLSVYLETKQGWEFIDFFPVAGPAAKRDLVMFIDLSKAGSEEVRIKLETGFMFWELDYAAMDFSENPDVFTTRIKPHSAVDNKGNDRVTDLLLDDILRLKLSEPGSGVILSYRAPRNTVAGKNHDLTIYLQCKGYYEQVVDYQNKPEWIHLVLLNRPHSFSEFSQKEYLKPSRN